MQNLLKISLFEKGQQKCIFLNYNCSPQTNADKLYCFTSFGKHFVTIHKIFPQVQIGKENYIYEKINIVFDLYNH